MKILIVSTYDIAGGAARAAYRLHQGLTGIGVDSSMLVQKKYGYESTVIGPETRRQKCIALIRFFLDPIPLRIFKNRRKTLFSPAWVPFSNIADKINSLNPDIVHLHWIASGMIRIEDLQRIKGPIVWSLHDMWAFTGGCHYDSLCEKYKSKCGSCPVLNSKHTIDISFRLFKRKLKIYNNIKDMTVVGLSRWITNCAKKSMLLKSKVIVNLPNPIDTKTFKPLDKKNAREMLNLPLQRKLILFGAMHAVSDPNKGFNELHKAIGKLSLSNKDLVIFGSGKPSEPIDFGFPVHYLGYFQDDIALRVLYSAVDVTVVPSLLENLSNVVMESLACGTPVVAFNVGGNPDLIVHKQNGYLARPFETSDIAKGIEWVINHSEPELLANNARKKVLDCFEMEKVAKRYKKLYEEIIDNMI